MTCFFRFYLEQYTNINTCGLTDTVNKSKSRHVRMAIGTCCNKKKKTDARSKQSNIRYCYIFHPFRYCIVGHLHCSYAIVRLIQCTDYQVATTPMDLHPCSDPDCLACIFECSRGKDAHLTAFSCALPTYYMLLAWPIFHKFHKEKRIIIIQY